MNPDLSRMSAASSYKSSILAADDIIDTVITIPPDGKWGWVVVTAAFMCNFVADGSIYTFGLFLQDISKTFHVNATTVAIGNSLMTGFYYTTGPLACAMVNRLGFQITGFAGGLVAGAAFFISSFQHSSITGFLLTFGVIGGVGFGMVYVPSIIVIGFYFEKWRALATSIAVTGSAAGIIGFPYIMQGLLSSYSWQAKFRVIAGGCIMCSFLALLYCPLKPVRVSAKNKKAIDYFDYSEGTSISTSNMSKKTGFFNKIFHRFHNVTYPTAAEVHRDSTVVLNLSTTGSSTSTIMTTNTLNESNVTILEGTPSAKTIGHAGLDNKLSTVYEVNQSGNKSRCKRCCRKIFCCKHCWCLAHKNRPMYRDDIFFTGSVYTLPRYSQASTVTKASTIRQKALQKPQRQQADTKKKRLEYHMSVSRVAVREGTSEKKHCQCCPESVVRTLVTMLNLNLLKSPAFLLLALSGFFTLLGMYIPFIYVEERAHECGTSPNISIHLLPTLGVSNAVGRIISGAVSTIPHANSLQISYISILVCGVATITSYFLRTTAGQFVFTAIFGLSIACFAALRAPIVVDMLGLEALTNAFGIILLFQGVAGFAGIPLAGEIVTVTGNFNSAYIFAGCVISLSAIMLMPLKHITAWEKKKLKLENNMAK